MVVRNKTMTSALTWLPQVLKLVGMALALTMLSELLFTFYIGVYDLSNMLGHLTKLASFWLVFVALVLLRHRGLDLNGLLDAVLGLFGGGSG